MQIAMCKLLCANCYVQTGCANWYVQNDIFACNFLNNGPILIILTSLHNQFARPVCTYVQTAMLCYVQTAMCKLLCANCYVQIAMCKLLCANCYVQTAMCKLLCANCYVQNDIFACNFLNNGPILIKKFLFESS